MQEKQRDKSLIKQNILKYLEFKDISDYKFYKDTGVARGVLSQKNGLSEENLTRFLAYATDVNTNWLLTGEGPILKNDAEPTSIPKVSYGAHIKNLFSDSTDEEIETLIAGEFAKHLLEMYEEGRAYPAIYVSQFRDEIDGLKEELATAQRRINELEKEIETLKK